MTDPLELLLAWRKDAALAGEPEPDAMALATALDGQPSCRIVLFRGLSQQRIRFFTNYESDKGRQLGQNPKAALTFFWVRLGIQVRLEGSVEKLSPAESDTYFAQRPHGHQLQALASPQSRPIGSLEEIQARHEALAEEYLNQPVPRPEYWGGYGLTPNRIEFWTNGGDRLHERRLFLPDGAGWRELKLAP